VEPTDLGEKSQPFTAPRSYPGAAPGDLANGASNHLFGDSLRRFLIANCFVNSVTLSCAAGFDLLIFDHNLC